MPKKPSSSRRKTTRKVTYVTLFADESLNPKYEAALKRLERGLGQSHPMHIGGKEAWSEAGEFEVRSPIDTSTAIGVQTDPRGYVITNERMQTNVSGVYAIGDVRGPPLLAHKASKEGIVAAECIAGLPSAADWKVVPEAVFCDPEVASVGLTEAKAVEAGYKVKRSRFQFAALGRALSAGEPEGFVKVVSSEESGLVLGVQIVGPEASNLISEAALAIEMGATVDDIALTVHPHPTLPEAIMEASESAAGHPIHQLRT
ncbi:MAG: FAD-dependent oxidoreductase [Thaumarchaeota archaeon]|nr:FAD-dependent oxidoreductase [Nitrososphaerota archaeon]